MIYWSVTSTAAPGKEEDALQWLKKLADYGREHFGAKIELCRPLDGAVSRYVWIEKHESMAAWDKVDKLFETDAGAIEIREQARGVFSHHEIHFWRTIG